jgi:hypothetical protein
VCVAAADVAAAVEGAVVTCGVLGEFVVDAMLVVRFEVKVDTRVVVMVV